MKLRHQPHRLLSPARLNLAHFRFIVGSHTLNLSVASAAMWTRDWKSVQLLPNLAMPICSVGRGRETNVDTFRMGLRCKNPNDAVVN